MKVLVTASSKHGSTAEIADKIGEVLTAAGIDTDVRPPDEVLSVTQYDGVVLGSGIYAGRWLGGAKQFAERESEALRAIPVWLFSSGPTGDLTKPTPDPADLAAVRAATGAVDHRVFAGKLDREDLGAGERIILRIVRAPVGDYRSWSDVAAWGMEIARKLQATPLAEVAR